MTTNKIKIEYKLNKQIYIRLLYYLQQCARWKVNYFNHRRHNITCHYIEYQTLWGGFAVDANPQYYRTIITLYFSTAYIVLKNAFIERVSIIVRKMDIRDDKTINAWRRVRKK